MGLQIEILVDMKKEILTVISNRPVDALSKVYQMELSGCSEEQRPGQFVNIELDGLFLRRPISVCDWKDGVLTLLYKLVGKGTALMATLQPGARLDVLCSLGNGFDIDIPSRCPGPRPSASCRRRHRHGASLPPGPPPQGEGSLAYGDIGLQHRL